MARITLKKSSIAGKVPQAADLALGELAINTNDGKLYVKKSTDGIDTIVTLGDLSDSEGASRVGYGSTTVADALNNITSAQYQTSFTPTPYTIPLGDSNGKIDAEWINPFTYLIAAPPLAVAGAQYGNTAAINTLFPNGTAGNRVRIINVAGRAYLDSTILPGGELKWTFGNSFVQAGRDVATIDDIGLNAVIGATTPKYGTFTKVTALDSTAPSVPSITLSQFNNEPCLDLSRWSGDTTDYLTYRLINNNGVFQLRYSTLGPIGGQTFKSVLEVSKIGMLTIGPKPIPYGPDSKHTIFSDALEHGEILQIGRASQSAPCAGFNGSDGTAGWSAAGSVFYIGKNSITNRSINMAGSITSNGSDAAEYLTKADDCGIIAKGQIVGIDRDGNITDKWANALSFAVKSTDPAWVGGDSWSQHVGPTPVQPIRTDDITDDEWVNLNNQFAIDLETYNISLENERQKVDRIAFWGRVPVNVYGAQPGQYIVPQQLGDGITAIAVNENDMTFSQYMKSVGKVWAIAANSTPIIAIKVS
jgi:hypothetical protein